MTDEVILEFYSPSCASCKVVDRILSRNERVVRVNVEIETEKTSYFAVTRLPTVIVMDKSRIRERIEGVGPEQLAKIVSLA